MGILYNETSGSCINSSITDDNDRTSSVIFIVLPEPEIDLMPKTLLITQNQTQNQTTANVTATINNSGNVSVNNVKIELLVDNFSIGNKTVNLSVNSETNVTFSWNATGGRHNITVKVDPDNLIVESNGYNNNLTAEIEVISCDCSSCWECEEKLNNPACLVVALTANITSHPGTCIDNPGNFSGKIFDCVGNTIGGDSSGVDYGIYLDVKSGNTIKNCGVRNFYYGIRLFSLSENSILENNNVSLNNYGILLTYFSNNNTLINNTVNSNGDAGIFLAYCSGNKIMNNTVNSNGYSGIHIEHSGGNVLERNTADNNGEHGIYLATGDSSGNLMNSNRFCNNSQKSISTHYTYYDIYNAGSNSGDGNTCDLAHSWSDVSFPLRNCTYLCTVPGKPDFAPFNLTYFPEYRNETMNVTIRAGVINLGNTSFAGGG